MELPKWLFATPSLAVNFCSWLKEAMLTFEKQAEVIRTHIKINKRRKRYFLI